LILVHVMEIVEFSAIDLCLEHTRRKDAEAERELLTSIMERDIEEPLSVVTCEAPHVYVLLDGFKRYRCARKLGKGTVPVRCMAQDIPCAILSMIRREAAGRLSVMEQAALIEELHESYGLSIGDIAVRLERSPAWVRIRLGMMSELSGLVRQKIMSGAFPVRAYLYGLRGFMQDHNVSGDRVDAFVRAVSGKGLSTRELFVLSRAYFTGGTAVERLIREGDAYRALRMLCADPDNKDDAALSERQRRFIKDLTATAASMNRIIVNVPGVNEGKGSFMQYVNLWSAAILRRLDEFSTVIKELYDRSGPCHRSAGPVP
jgi:ParB/RepB/Spo0J family partition protein